MVTIKKEGIILYHTDLEFENDGVLNPAVYQDGNTVHLFYRAVREGNFSTIGYAKLNGPLEVEDRLGEPLIAPSSEIDKQGVEDARIVKIDDTFYMSYTSYDGINALGSYATSKDLKEFKKHGIIVPQVDYKTFCELTSNNHHLNDRYAYYNCEKEGEEERHGFISDKNLIFFPRKIDGKFTFLHRIRPDIQIASVNDLSELTTEFWHSYLQNLEENILLTSKYDHESSYIGGGCPPIETPEGWLVIYHGVRKSEEGYVYSACASLLDLENPSKEIARLPYPLFTPDQKWELTGYVNNVVFPTGTARFDERLYIYYGAADKRIAAVSLEFDELVNALLDNKVS
ncbi:pesticidal protein Cry7Aa [Flavobacterium frigidarium]|uniref:glycoside hydrolase family 130 protein n=1 Tax=Flavobacterium frigidarium TaxID=99286 RepID=UPI0030DC56CE|tara:strand:+ start:1169 stop:2197 length:1029 start_codon:yes stop_codon:yes gene_type:complete